MQKIQEHDRIGILIGYARSAINMTAHVSEVIGKSHEIAVYKEHFHTFYGARSSEHLMAHSLLSLILVMERSVETKADNGDEKVKDWVKKENFRGFLLNAIKNKLDPS